MCLHIAMSNIAFRTLYKHCKAKHVPEKGRFLRIGTLSDFRRQENKFVQDKDEGSFSVNLNFDGKVRVSKEWFQSVTFRASLLELFGFPAGGRFSNNTSFKQFKGIRTTGIITGGESVNILEDQQSHLVLEGTIGIRLVLHDAHVFCLSSTSEIGSVILDSEYTHVWSVDRKNVKEFVDRLVELVGEAFTRENLITDIPTGGIHHNTAIPLHLREKSKFVNDFVMSNVHYMEKDIKVRSEGDIMLPQLYSILDNADRIKPLRFCSEAEERLVVRSGWDVEGTFFPIANELRPIFVSCDSLLDLMDVVKLR